MPPPRVRRCKARPYADWRSVTCDALSTLDSFFIKVLTSSPVTFERLSASETRYVFKVSASSASGRTVTPLRATRIAPALTTKARHEPLTKGNASSG